MQLFLNLYTGANVSFVSNLHINAELTSAKAFLLLFGADLIVLMGPDFQETSDMYCIYVFIEPLSWYFYITKVHYLFMLNE